MTLAAPPAATGTIGFLVILALGIASYLLFRSMTKRLRNVERNAEHWPGSGDADPPTPRGDGSTL